MFRTLLMCLLMLALPVQGWAMQRMLFCAPDTHTVVHAPADNEHAAHHHMEHSKADANAKAGDMHQHTADPGHGKCSACASCCTGLALLAAPLTFGASAPTAHYAAAVFSGHSGHVPHRLDRPPRSALA
ncbi:MAG TPA: hypothetical protein VFL64_21525 [Rhizobacter sp.]|nr:hypothetical protein [Rhizobacter sp.]